jgi:hypothetical protein
MNTCIKSLAAAIVGMALAAGSAFADGPNCERLGSRAIGDGEIVASTSLPFYAHGCDLFQHQPLSPATARNLIASGNCSVESSADGLTIEEEVVVVDYEVADGSEHERDNLTSMGAAASSGSQVMRVRSATDGNPVTITRYGSGEVWSGTVDRGDTFVQVGDAGTYIAETGSRRITKATGPQTFDDVETIEREIATGGTWSAENANRQPGPRGERCGFAGEMIPPLN